MNCLWSGPMPEGPCLQLPAQLSEAPQAQPANPTGAGLAACQIMVVTCKELTDIRALLVADAVNPRATLD